MKVPLISILLIAAAIVGWQFMTRPSSGEIAVPVVTNPTHTPAPLTTTPVIVKQHPRSAPFQESDGEDYELIHGYRFRKDRDCHIEVEEVINPETLDVSRVFSCTPLTPRQPDPYESYGTETLAGMAYGDAHAAEVLGVRLLHSSEPELEAIGLRYLLHAVALTNDTRGIALAVNHGDNSLSTNGVVNLESIKRLVVLSHISNTITPGTMSGAAYQQMLRDNAVSEEEIAELIARGDAWLENMAQVQTEITGNTDIREALNDA